ncbi:MAG TPA: CTP synthase [bacterium]|nr:CTP synthase [bacterium]
MKQTKYIFFTGGVISSLGKGIASTTVGALLESRGITVNLLKFDPYINVDPGTMSPFQHGEVFVTDDGAETDLDLGHYERFCNITVGRGNNFTTGQIYDTVITKERKGEYLGKTVQVIPHITNEIKSKITQLAPTADIIQVEIGGTVGDIESLPFLEAIRQFAYDVGRENVLYVHLTLIPYIRSAGEFKTKPTQHSVKELRAIGIQPDILLCRCETEMTDDMREKIALFTNVKKEAVFSAVDVKNIYELPLVYARQGVDEIIAKYLNIWSRSAGLKKWETICERINNPKGTVRIAVVGKYVDLKESYKSLNEALHHGGIENSHRVELNYIDSEKLEKGEFPVEELGKCDGILVPGGFGNRGIEGKIMAARYARENKIPYFGICLGMQIATIEFARHVCGMTGAHSTEFDKNTKYPVIDLMEGQKGLKALGGTMRLGAYTCAVEPGTLAHAAYKTNTISERHRHRLEFNSRFEKELAAKGLKITGRDKETGLVEMVELTGHPYFLGCQFHPEFKSKPFQPHPLFSAFVAASIKNKEHHG